MYEYDVTKKFDDQTPVPTTAADARDSDGLVFWRPSGVISETPDSDACLVKQG